MRQLDLFLSLKRDLALVSLLADLSFTISGHFLYLTMCSFVVSVQCIQEVFTAKEWVNEARNEAKAEATHRVEADKALGASK